MRSPVAVPDTVDDALDALEELHDSTVLAGGTDVMVQLNFGERRPGGVVALRRIRDLKGWTTTDDALRLGPMLTYREMQYEMAVELPALAMAARTVGSPPIRNRGTVGGNLVTASPAGDLLPILLALDAEVELRSVSGSRTMSVRDFLVGPKRSACGRNELVQGIRVPRVNGPQHFLKVGPRNAMVISVASLGLVLDVDRRRATCALGSVGPTALRVTEAENFLTERVEWSALQVADDDIAEFARRAAMEASPITDKRGTDDYRRHCIEVLAARAVKRSIGREG